MELQGNSSFALKPMEWGSLWTKTESSDDFR
jgi:hypothetical protein